MSQGKSYDYRVSPEALRRAEVERLNRALDAAHDQFGMLAEEIDSARETYGARISSPTVPPRQRSDDPDVLRRHLNAVNAAWAAGRVRLQQQKAAVFNDQALSALVDSLEDGPLTAPEVELDDVHLHETESIRQTVDDVLDRLSEGVPKPTIDAIGRLVREINRSRSVQRMHALVDSLRQAVLDANRVVKRTEDDAEEAAALRARLMETAPQAATPLAARLDEVIAGSATLTHELRAEVSAACISTAEEKEAAVAGAIIRDVLADLGYEVQSGFDSRVADQGALARKRGWEHHAVRVTAIAGKLDFDVVQTEPLIGGAALDLQPQNEFCADLESIEVGFRARSLTAQRTRRIPPGIFELPTVDARSVTYERGRSQSGRREQEEEL